MKNPNPLFIRKGVSDGTAILVKIAGFICAVKIYADKVAVYFKSDTQDPKSPLIVVYFWFNEQRKPDWEKMLADKKGRYAVCIATQSTTISKKDGKQYVNFMGDTIDIAPLPKNKNGEQNGNSYGGYNSNYGNNGGNYYNNGGNGYNGGYNSNYGNNGGNNYGNGQYTGQPAGNYSGQYNTGHPAPAAQQNGYNGNTGGYQGYNNAPAQPAYNQNQPAPAPQRTPARTPAPQGQNAPAPSQPQQQYGNNAAYGAPPQQNGGNYNNASAQGNGSYGAPQPEPPQQSYGNDNGGYGGGYGGNGGFGGYEGYGG